MTRPKIDFDNLIKSQEKALKHFKIHLTAIEYDNKPIANVDKFVDNYGRHLPEGLHESYIRYAYKNRILLDYREYFNNEYGWTIWTREEIYDMEIAIDSYYRKVWIDVGSGYGLFAKHRKQVTGRSTICVDDFSDYLEEDKHKVGKYYPVQFKSVKDASEEICNCSRVFTLIFPRHKPCMEVLDITRRGDWIVYLGEGGGACNAGEEFFDRLDADTRYEQMFNIEQMLNEKHLKFDGIHDRYYIYFRRD